MRGLGLSLVLMHRDAPKWGFLKNYFFPGCESRIAGLGQPLPLHNVPMASPYRPHPRQRPSRTWDRCAQKSPFPYKGTANRSNSQMRALSFLVYPFALAAAAGWVEMFAPALKTASIGAALVVLFPPVLLVALLVAAEVSHWRAQR